MKKITKINKPILPKRLRVAAYARISCVNDDMLHSLSQQVSYYTDLIQSRPDWEFVGIYTDHTTGTKASRPQFQRMIEDCRNGAIDMIITKSISRMARNTVTLLETTRELKSLGIDVFFEEQNIHTMSADGELMLTIIASYAQEESLSVSENCKWRIRRRFADGEITGLNFMFGYNIAGGRIEKDAEQAEIVEMIFADYISGMGSMQIAKKLTQMDIETCFGGKWNSTRVIAVLKNEKYTGSALLQKTFISDHLTKRKTKNRGELPQYYAEETHPAIVSDETFERVQQIMAERKDYYKLENRSGVTYPFTGKIVCGKCGKHYRRKTTATQITWQCAAYLQYGKSSCSAKQIPERVLFQLSADVLDLREFDEKIFADEIEQIEVTKANHVTFVFTDGHTAERIWTLS